MQNIPSFLAVVAAYSEATDLAEATVSSRLFNDGKRIQQVRSGADIGVRRLQRAILWLWQHWPEGAKWPEQVPRPIVEREEPVP